MLHALGFAVFIFSFGYFFSLGHYFALIPVNRAPDAFAQTLTGQVSGEPGWVGAIECQSAIFAGHQDLAASIAFAAAYVIIAAGVWLPERYPKASLVLALSPAVAVGCRIAMGVTMAFMLIVML